MRRQRIQFKPGDRAVARNGHVCKILQIWYEEGIAFAMIRYLDGFNPYPVAGRVAGTEDEPVWEHRVTDGKVVQSGGDYYNPNDWVTEKGLRKVRNEWLGLKEGVVVATYPNQAQADAALRRYDVQSVTPAVR